MIGQGNGAGSGAIAATSVTVVSPTKITAVTGGGAKAGTWTLFVITSGGTRAGNSGSSPRLCREPELGPDLGRHHHHHHRDRLRQRRCREDRPGQRHRSGAIARHRCSHQDHCRHRRGRGRFSFPWGILGRHHGRRAAGSSIRSSRSGRTSTTTLGPMARWGRRPTNAYGRRRPRAKQCTQLKLVSEGLITQIPTGGSVPWAWPDRPAGGRQGAVPVTQHPQSSINSVGRLPELHAPRTAQRGVWISLDQVAIRHGRLVPLQQ